MFEPLLRRSVCWRINLSPRTPRNTFSTASARTRHSLVSKSVPLKGRNRPKPAIQGRCRERPLSDRKAAVQWPRSVRQLTAISSPSALQVREQRCSFADDVRHCRQFLARLGPLVLSHSVTWWPSELGRSRPWSLGLHLGHFDGWYFRAPDPLPVRGPCRRPAPRPPQQRLDRRSCC